MSMIGTSVTRIEDPDLLTVGGRYVDDLAPADALHITFVRSMMPHARLVAVDLSEAEAHPDCVAAFTAQTLGLQARSPSFGPLNQDMRRTALADGVVRYVGEPVVALVTNTRAGGVDAAELVVIDYDDLPLVLRPKDSVAPEAPIIFPEAGTNVAFTIPSPVTEAEFIEGAENVLELEFRNHRMSPAPLEPRAAISKWEMIDGVEHLTQWASTQGAHGTRDGLAAAVGVDPSQVRVICPDVGGGFGAKNGNYPEDQVCAHVARALGRPTRWTETRSESMVGLVHGRAVEFRCLIGGTGDGRITHYSLDSTQDSGGHAAIGALLPFFTHMMTSGIYDIEHVRFTAKSVITNTVPVGAYRGAGRPEATHAIERMVDLFATHLGLDPVEVRRKNMLQPEKFPLTTSTGANMDSGDYEGALDRVLAAADYAALRSEQQARRADPASTSHLGIGLSTYVEITNPMGNQEYGSVEVNPDGTALVLTGSSSHGQGHHTTFAQLASGQTGIPIDKITVRHGDTAEVPRGSGTGGSKSLQLGGSAVLQASDAVVDLAKAGAADLLEANPSDITLNNENGEFHVVGTPAVSVAWQLIASTLSKRDERLHAEIDFKPAGATFPFGAHLCVVEVEAATGSVKVRRFIACDDAGVIVNPMLVEGQVHGGIAAGVGHALYEEFVYDESGNPITSNFMDYAFPSAAEFGMFERIPMETPTPRNPLGAKGIGESGTIGSTPAVQNAVVDALSHLGITHIELPATPQRVWKAMQQ